MHKTFFTLIAASALFLLTGCYDNIQEITLAENGTGTLRNTNDLSSLMGLVKQMAGEEEMAKAGEQKLDSTFHLGDNAEGLEELSDDEKALASKGTLRVNLDVKDEKFMTELLFPFKDPSEINAFNKLSTKILSGATRNMVGEGLAGADGDEMPEPSSLDDYYTLDFSKGKLIKKLNAEKYANVDKDEFLKQMKEAGNMGVEMKNTYIINLPHPATKAEGSRVKLSEDKMKVTLTTTISDFFDDPALLEFDIEY